MTKLTKARAEFVLSDCDFAEEFPSECEELDHRDAYFFLDGWTQREEIAEKEIKVHLDTIYRLQDELKALRSGLRVGRERE